MELFVILVNSFQPLYIVTMRSILVVVGVVYLPLRFIFFVIIITIVIVIVIIISIINVISFTLLLLGFLNKNSLRFLWGKLTVWFCCLHFLHVPMWSMRPPFCADALLQNNYLPPFNHGVIKASGIGRIVDFQWAWFTLLISCWFSLILCLIFSPIIIKR